MGMIKAEPTKAIKKLGYPYNIPHETMPKSMVKAIFSEMLGRGWMGALAKQMGVHRSLMTHWFDEKHPTPIPGHVILTLRLLVMLRRRNINLRKIFIDD